MKTCTACSRLYPDDGGFCPIDGQRLAGVSEVAPPTRADDPRLGQTLCGGRYQVWRTVADGGMGRVYQALDLAEQRSVAMKILHRDVAGDEVSRERFRREFALSETLSHDHVVRVLGFEQTEDQSYALVMEYLEGEELRMLLQRENVLPPERVVRMVAQIALGLASAHARQIVHRDLKPDNVFLCGTHDGDIVKILDFGSVRDNSDRATSKKLTVMGTTIGSPFYMAPEQAQGLESLDHRADVWSLAAIVYECLTGCVPFEGKNGPAILVAILTKEPKRASVAGAAHGVPPTVDVVFEAALAKNPDERVPTIGELADRLGQAFGLEGTHHEWARLTQQELARRIAAGLPGALERHAAAGPRQLDALDAAFAAADPFRAGLEGGPAAAGTFDEDMIMGLPSSTPRWVIPAVAGVAVLVGVLVTVLLLRG